MILGIYISLGVFLLIAARNPSEHRSLILFAGWSTLAHDGVMIGQGIQYHDMRGDLLGFATIAVIGLALIALVPAKQARASENAHCHESVETNVRALLSSKRQMADRF